MPLAILLALFQLPASEQLSPDAAKFFREEVQRLESQLKTANDPGTVTYALARTYAAGGQYPEALDWLNKMVDLNLGLDPSYDSKFAKLKGTAEFAAILDRVRNATPPVVHSRIAFAVDDEDLNPEGIAYSPATKRFFIGSTSKHKIVGCSGGDCRTFAAGQGLGEVLGIKISPLDGSVWAASNLNKEAGLFHFTAAGKLLRKYSAPGARYFNDLAIDVKGNVYVTDTQAGTVFWLARATDRLELLNDKLNLPSANGIALSDDGSKLYVTSFGAGLTVIELPSRSFHPVPHPPNLCLASIDGLVFYKKTLIAIQNGIMTPRVARFVLTPDLNRIASFEVLERRNPQFDGITTGAIADGWFYYMANVDAHGHPATILKLDLSSRSVP